VVRFDVWKLAGSVASVKSLCFQWLTANVPIMFRLDLPCCLYVLGLFLVLTPPYEASRANLAMSGVMFMVCIRYVLVLFSSTTVSSLFTVCSDQGGGGHGPRARMESVLPTYSVT